MFTHKRLHRQSSKAAKDLYIEDPGHLGFDYHLRFSNRKTIALQVRNGEVRISGPHQVSKLELEKWLESKLDWVRTKLDEQQQYQQQIPRRQYIHGELWPFMGQQIRLLVQRGKKKSFHVNGGELLITLSERSFKPEAERIASILTDWYKLQAIEILEKKTQQICAELGAQCSAVRLKRTRSKWGHCTPRGVIQYNWLIIQAPEWIIDYLVIHECCHLIHPNHSSTYWDLVAQLMPNYKQAKQWLKHNGHQLIV